MPRIKAAKQYAIGLVGQKLSENIVHTRTALPLVCLYHNIEEGKTQETKKAPHLSVKCFAGCGGWIWTNDLRVMSPTSFPCSTPRYPLSSLVSISQYIRGVKHLFKKVCKNFYSTTFREKTSLFVHYFVNEQKFGRIWGKRRWFVCVSQENQCFSHEKTAKKFRTFTKRDVPNWWIW